MMKRKAGLEDLHDEKRRFAEDWLHTKNKQIKKAECAKNTDKHKVFMLDHNVLWSYYFMLVAITSYWFLVAERFMFC